MVLRYLAVYRVPCSVCRVPYAVFLQLGDERLQAQQVSVCVDVAKRAKRVVMVSGTPALSKPFEIFNQVLCVAGIAQVNRLVLQY